MATTFKVIVNGQHQLAVDPSQGTLLEAIEAAGIESHFHCRNGFCGACRTVLQEGQVNYLNEPLAFIRPGDCLPCCCVPASDLKIEHR